MTVTCKQFELNVSEGKLKIVWIFRQALLWLTDNFIGTGFSKACKREKINLSMVPKENQWRKVYFECDLQT